MCFCGGSFVIVMLLLTLRNLVHAMPCDYCRMERILNRNSYCNVQLVGLGCFLPNIYIYIVLVDTTKYTQHFLFPKLSKPEMLDSFRP